MQKFIRQSLRSIVRNQRFFVIIPSYSPTLNAVDKIILEIKQK